MKSAKNEPQITELHSPKQTPEIVNYRVTMLIAAGAAMAAVQHELLCAKSRQSCFLVQDLRVGDQVAPGSGRVNVDLDDARVGGYLDALEPVVVGCLVAFEHHGGAGLPGGSLDGGDEVEPVLKMGQGRKEQVQDAEDSLAA